MKRAAVILANSELNPFYSIVIFDDENDVTQTESKIDEALQEHFRKNWEAPEGDSPDDWFDTILGDYDFFLINIDIGKILSQVEIPEVDIDHRLNPSDEARALLERLMISVCRQFEC